MTKLQDTKTLALLVHRGLLDADIVRTALANKDPGTFLIESGVVSAEQWREWCETEAGTRPKLTRYDLGEMLGEGGQARVFRAVDRKTGEEVALKVLKSEEARDTAIANRFVAESKMLMEFDCPHIVGGLRVAREGAVLFCAMELIEGECVQDRLAREERIEEELALRVVAQVARALEYLHGRGLVHRDVKPGNIMLAVTPEGEQRAVLIDLGFAVGGDVGDSETTAGTVHYISPEQARGQGGLDVRADIYSLGATLYHLVTGSLPFSGGSSEEVMAKQVREALSGARIRDMGLSPQLHYFIEKMMAKEKEIRFQDPRQLAEEITRYLGKRERERQTEDADKKRRTRRRRRWL